MVVKQIIFKYVLQTSSWLRLTMSDMCWRAFEHSLQGNTGICLKETENNKKLCGLSDNQVFFYYLLLL